MLYRYALLRCTTDKVNSVYLRNSVILSKIVCLLFSEIGSPYANRFSDICYWYGMFGDTYSSMHVITHAQSLHVQSPQSHPLCSQSYSRTHTHSLLPQVSSLIPMGGTMSTIQAVSAVIMEGMDSLTASITQHDTHDVVLCTSAHTYSLQLTLDTGVPYCPPVPLLLHIHTTPIPPQAQITKVVTKWTPLSSQTPLMPPSPVSCLTYYCTPVLDMYCKI
jgi:hypothetical protein